MSENCSPHRAIIEAFSRANPGERIVLTTKPPLVQSEANGILRRTTAGR